MNGLFSLLRSSTSKDSAVLFAGNIASFVINFLITLILARNFSTSELGLFFTGLIFIQLVTDLSELGINSSLMHFIPKSDSRVQKSFVNASFILKVVVGISFFCLILLFSPLLATLLFNDKNMNSYIQNSSVGIFVLLFIFWGQAIFQAQKKFIRASLVNFSINILRIIVLIVLISTVNFELRDIYLAFQLILIIPVIFLIYTIKPKLGDLNQSTNLLRFGLPIGASFAVAAIYTKLDQILVLKLAGDYQAGVYGLAGRIATIYIFATAAFNSAILPRLVSIEKTRLDQYFNKTILASVIISVGVLISIIPLSLLIPFLKSDFIESVQPFQILSIGAIFFILSAPFSAVIVYRYKKTFFPLILSLLSLILLMILLNLLIPIYLSIGAALSLLITYITQALVSVGYFFYIRKTLKTGNF